MESEREIRKYVRSITVFDRYPVTPQCFYSVWLLDSKLGTKTLVREEDFYTSWEDFIARARLNTTRDPEFKKRNT